MVSPLRRVPFGRRPKRNQKVSPRTYGPSLRLGVPSLRHSSGGIASGRLRSTSSRCVRLRRTALRAHPRMNASTQPAEGAGGSRSRAAGELTLGLMSGEEQWCTRLCICSAVGASSRWRPASRPKSCRCTEYLWERACPRRRPASRSKSFRCTEYLWERVWSGRRSDDSGLPVDQVHHRQTNPAIRPAGRPPRFGFGF